jgi:hypothetical protein
VLSGSICSALRSAGFLVQTYTNSFNHYENTAGVGYEEYFSRRSANLRYNVRRRIRSLAKNGAPEFNLYCDDNGLDQGINDYIAVSKSSWKPPGSMIAPELIALIRLAAEKDCLRLGILRVDDKAVAAQFWIISAGVANCIRLAYDEACKKKAVGVVLTNHMITHVLDHDHVDNIDFGYGDDAYKAGWMKDCRYYEGCIAFNPATMQGFYNGVKHIAGRPLKRVINTLIEKIHRARP